jgi:hypothetical protein
MATNKANEIVKSPCPECGDDRNHDILCFHRSDGGDGYHCEVLHMVIKCRGCEKVSFRYVFSDYEAAYPISDNEWKVPRTIKTYPRFIKDHKTLEGTHCVPDLVREIYEETLLAIQEEAAMLAGLGLRGTIEAVCNERQISGRDLKTRISRLATQGWISQKDAERLHAIRFLGNDAAHEIKRPTKAQIEVALRIIEHLIVTVYILDDAARGNLDTMISSYEDFKSLLIEKISAFTSGDELPLAKLLGKDVRRIEAAMSSMESQLISEIQAGGFPQLTIGKIDVFAGSPTALQHFVKV